QIRRQKMKRSKKGTWLNREEIVRFILCLGEEGFAPPEYFAQHTEESRELLRKALHSLALVFSQFPGYELEDEEIDYVVCPKADVETPFVDNVTGECCACGAKIIHRPNDPSAPKICIDCARHLSVETAKL